MGVDARGFPGGLLRLDPVFAYVEPPSSWPLPWAECLTLAPHTGLLLDGLVGSPWSPRDSQESSPCFWIIKKAREFQKNIYFYFIDYAFDCVDHNKLWKILQEMGIPDHLTCLLRNLYAGQEATVRTGHGTTEWFQIGEGVRQGCILSLCLFNFYAEYIMRKTDWKKHKLESRLQGEISITSDMQMTPPLWQKVKRN